MFVPPDPRQLMFYANDPKRYTKRHRIPQPTCLVLDHLLRRAIRQPRDCSRQLVWKRVDSLSCLLRKAILPRPRWSRCRGVAKHGMFKSSSNQIYVLDVARESQALQFFSCLFPFSFLFHPQKKWATKRDSRTLKQGAVFKPKEKFVYGQKQYQHAMAAPPSIYRFSIQSLKNRISEWSSWSRIMPSQNSGRNGGGRY